MTETAIEIRGLEKKFWGFQLGPIDITVPEGGIYALIGPNGAGKTTTFDLMMGMGREDAGTIRIFGMDHREQEADVKARIGYVTPDLNYGAWKMPKRLVHFSEEISIPIGMMDYCAETPRATRDRVGRLDSQDVFRFKNQTGDGDGALSSSRPAPPR